MKAMIFAAGLGTRLRPLTDTCPKALIPIGEKPLLQIVIEHLKKHGVTEAVVNIHYLGELVKAFLKEHNNFGIRIEISDESEQLLETGGGLWKAKDFFDNGRPFVVGNADVLTNIHIGEFYQSHLKKNPLATLAVRKRKSSRLLLFDEKENLCGWKNANTGEVKMPRKSEVIHEFAFSGYHVISPEIFNYPTRQGVFSMTDWYLDICASHTIALFDHSEDLWIDIGSRENLEEARKRSNELND